MKTIYFSKYSIPEEPKRMITRKSVCPTHTAGKRRFKGWMFASSQNPYQWHPSPSGMTLGRGTFGGNQVLRALHKGKRETDLRIRLCLQTRKVTSLKNRSARNEIMDFLIAKTLRYKSLLFKKKKMLSKVTLKMCNN